MRIKYSKEIEFFFKKNFFSQSYLLRRRLERAIKKNEENEIKLVKNFIKNDTDTLDIGVYRGVYSYEMSKYSKTVHAFEPNPIIYKDLDKNLKKIVKNINLYNFALSNKNEDIELKIPIRDLNSNKENYEEYYQLGKATIHKENELKNFEKCKIISKKIDDLDFKNKISFIKIDVEGHEKEVIEGGVKTIQKNKPVLLIEIEKQYSKRNVSDTINFINSLGFTSYFFDNIDLKKTNDLDNLNKYNNFIFKPN